MDTITSTNKLLFTSDVHLGGFSKTQNKKVEKEFIELIDFCEKKNFKMHVLGDLFDYWMEYPADRPTVGKRCIVRFKKYNSKTGNTLFITGNHDNWTNGFFKSIGFDLEKNQRILDIDGTKVMLMHGDGLENPTFNLKRPLLHRFLRHPLFIKIYQTLLPAKYGLNLMKWFSRWMRSREQTGLEDIRLNKWSETKLKSSDIDVIICGHDHCPRVINYEYGTYINLGTFYNHKTVATYNNGKISLVVWDNTAGQLKPFTPQT